MNIEQLVLQGQNCSDGEKPQTNQGQLAKTDDKYLELQEWVRLWLM